MTPTEFQDLCKPDKYQALEIMAQNLLGDTAEITKKSDYHPLQIDVSDEAVLRLACSDMELFLAMNNGDYLDSLVYTRYDTVEHCVADLLFGMLGTSAMNYVQSRENMRKSLLHRGDLNTNQTMQVDSEIRKLTYAKYQIKKATKHIRDALP